MSEPSVTVTNAPSTPVDCAAIVLSYNGLEVLKRCLPSTFDQGAVYVVDNGSNDGTAEYVARVWPNVAVVRISSNVGLGVALNIGAAAARARKIVLMNNDAIVLEDALVKMSALLDQHPRIGLVSPMLLNEDGSVQEFGNDMHLTGLAAHPRRTERPIFDTFFQSGCVTAVRRDEFLRMGGYGEEFEWYYEDVDLAWRYRNAGYRVVVDERARCVHLRGATLGNSLTVDRSRISDARHIRRMYYSNRNVLLLFARNAPWYQVALQIPFILARHLLEALSALAAGDRTLAAAYPRAWRDAIRKIPKALEAVNGDAPATRRSTLRFVRVQVSAIASRLGELIKPFVHRSRADRNV